MIKHFILLLSLLTLGTYSINFSASPYDLNFTEHKEIEGFIKEKKFAINKDPDSKKSSKLYLLRGDAFFLLGDFDKAIKDYSHALKLDSNQNEAYLGKGLALARSGRIEEGILELDIYIKRNPKSSLAYTKRGVRRLWLGDHEQAQKDFEQALLLDPSNAEAHDDLGVIFA